MFGGSSERILPEPSIRVLQTIYVSMETCSFHWPRCSQWIYVKKKPSGRRESHHNCCPRQFDWLLLLIRNFCHFRDGPLRQDRRRKFALLYLSVVAILLRGIYEIVLPKTVFRKILVLLRSRCNRKSF